MDNCYEKAMEMADILDRISELCNRKGKARNINESKLLDKQIEDLEIQYHTIKHSLMKIDYKEVN